MPRLELLPGGKILKAPKGERLRDILFNEGVEFPCGGLGRCRRCKVRVLHGHWPISLTDLRLLSADELREGWRLSCQGFIQENLTLEIAQWDSPILADETTFEFTPAEGLGIAIDLGTTTIAAQLLDLETASILAVTTALNAQGAHGADVMTRLDFALTGGAAKLTHLIRAQINDIVNALLAKSNRAAGEIRSVVLVGNTAMHHLFCGLPLDQLARDPFEPYSLAPEAFIGSQLGWNLSDLHISFLPPIGGFVGSDILAGVVATRLHKNPACVALMDLGTNGEVVVAHAGKILCASTAAGPAFEGARITSGMRAATGAIDSVQPNANGFHCHILGGGKPRGICGSGLVDAIATGLDAEIITPTGRFASGAPTWPLLDTIALHQKDIRELQLAKGAIAAGLIILLQETGATLADLDQIYLAGAFGNYINRESATRIGLVPIAPNKVIQAGNTALLGAKLALFPEYRAEFDSLQRQIQHVPLNERADFQENFLEQIQFPKLDRAESELLSMRS
jgi:uncharacterized 2Fe-2S/4Fe-4S cluster protein (DUF4445 family)